MTAPSLRALGTVSSGSTGTPSFAAPAGAQGTDVIVVGMFTDGGATTVTAAPSGFQIPTGAPQTANHELRVYYGRLADVGAGPYVFTLSASVFVEGRTAAIQGCKTSGSPIDSSAGNTSVSTSVSTAPAVSATSSGADRYAFYMATNWSGGAWTPPAGFNELWDGNTRIITMDELSLPTAQTISPQAVNASTDKMTAWVGIFLPEVSVPAVPQPRVVKYGKLTNPQAGGTVVNSGPLVAGRYRVSIATKPSGTLTSADANNVQLLDASGGTVGVLQMSATADFYTPNPDVVINVTAGGTISVVAAGNGSGASAVYGAVLVCEPEALYP